jgi:hypothetical protein
MVMAKAPYLLRYLGEIDYALHVFRNGHLLIQDMMVAYEIDIPASDEVTLDLIQCNELEGASRWRDLTEIQEGTCGIKGSGAFLSVKHLRDHALDDVDHRMAMYDVHYVPRLPLRVLLEVGIDVEIAEGQDGHDMRPDVAPPRGELGDSPTGSDVEALCHRARGPSAILQRS